MSGQYDDFDYGGFDQLRDLMAMKRVGPAEYAKYVQTGQSGICDHGQGFLYLQILEHNHHCIRVFIDSIDDSYGDGWTAPILDATERIERARQIAEVFRNMVTLPTLDELNVTLQPLGVFLSIEN